MQSCNIAPHRLSVVLLVALGGWITTSSAAEEFEITQNDREYWAFRPVVRPDFAGIDAVIDATLYLRIHCPEIDQPIAGLLADLEQRGMLDETLVVWGGEFGRQPVWQGNNGGRDHNPKGFTYWMAGAGVKAGTSYGETDELGHEAAVDKHHVRDLHATILHLMGLDHQTLTYHYGGLDQRLTGVVPAAVIRGVLS